jgi:hypothetical protein
MEEAFYCFEKLNIEIAALPPADEILSATGLALGAQCQIDTSVRKSARPKAFNWDNELRFTRLCFTGRYDASCNLGYGCGS